ncbi:Chloroperoxidase [Ophiocordyceps sinensis CO18]|uniref:Chloroperoxidase n=1 Tax=Ophiocordyceps sinensis (strain Co18 / CGMCC 3.14243) TaxID=911162 RepID=T5A512_OPHSC|nr:Chloroperoxidase [Ophiocordyceps sinensis CO18]
MKPQTPHTFLLWLLASGLSLAERPRLDLDDARFKDWKPAGDGDSRSACPGLNSLANHGFLPHDGTGINAQSVVRACFEGFGMSPEVPAIIVLKGLEDAGLGINDNFNLHDADRSSWKIEHSRSFTRQDIGSGRSARRVFSLPATGLGRCSPRPRGLWGGVLSTANYDRAAAGHGAVESARLLLMLGSAEGAQLNFIRSVLEQEKLPRDLGWEPQEFSGRIDVMLDVAARSQAPDKMLRCASNGRVATRLDIIKLFESSSPDFTERVKNLLRDTDFDDEASIFEALDRIDGEKKQDEADQKSTECDPDSQSQVHESDSDGHDRDSEGDSGSKPEEGSNAKRDDEKDTEEDSDERDDFDEDDPEEDSNTDDEFDEQDDFDEQDESDKRNDDFDE